MGDVVDPTVDGEQASTDLRTSPRRRSTLTTPTSILNNATPWRRSSTSGPKYEERPDPHNPQAWRRSSMRNTGDVGDVLAVRTSISEASSLASIDRPPSAEENLPASKVYEPLSFPVLAILAAPSVFGVLARLGLQALTTYPGQSIFSLAWAQTIGCFIMGIALGLKEPIGELYGPLYTAITTGFCGSLTTFSGWQQDIFNSWDNAGNFHRNWLRDVVDGFTKLFGTLGLALVAVSFGARIGNELRPFIPRMSLLRREVRYTLSALSVCIYAATLPAYFLLPADFRHQATAAMLFSYPGTLTRYLLSIELNPRLKALPLGTLTANLFGTTLLATFHLLQNTHTLASPNACALLQGLLDGYCGCLTTVSTFASEVDALQMRKAWRYVACSVLGAQLLLLVVLGPSFWAGGVSEQIQCRFA